jgi:hypothetical protein
VSYGFKTHLFQNLRDMGRIAVNGRTGSYFIAGSKYLDNHIPNLDIFLRSMQSP